MSAVAVSLAVSSCTKKFDPSSYAPPLNIGGYISSKEIAPTNLVAYWAFDGALLDSVSKTSGVNTGTGFSSGIKGQALQGALNAYVIANTTDAVKNLTSFTVTCWTNSPLNDKGIVPLLDIADTKADWGNLTLFFENGGTAAVGKLQARTYSGVVNDGGDNFLKLVDPFNKWVQIAYSYDQATSTYKVYLNGSKIGSKTIANAGPLAFKNATQIVFGTTQFQTTPQLGTMGKQDWASYLVGKLDEVRIYNKALTDDEVSSLQKLEGKGK